MGKICGQLPVAQTAAFWHTRSSVEIRRFSGVVLDGEVTGCGAAWIARLTGGQKVAGSNPVTPIFCSPEQGGQPIFKCSEG